MDARNKLVSAARAAGYRLTLLDGHDDPDAPTPLVVLVGWFGAQDKHLAKYAELVNSLGYSTLRVQMPPTTTFSLRVGPRRAFAVALLRFLDASGLLLAPPTTSAASPPPRPLVFYFFSNGGVFVYEQVCEVLAEAPSAHGALRAAHCGTLFDSSPAYIRAATASMLFSMLAREPLRFLRPLLAWSFRTLVAALDLLPSGVVDVGANRAACYWATLEAVPARVPECYLYSADDPLCEPGALEELQEVRRGLGIAVTSRRWEVSQHVGHLRCHPDQYTATVQRFLLDVTRAVGGKAHAPSIYSKH